MKKNVDEIVEELIEMYPYWWRWEFLKIKQDTPEIYDEVCEKFNKREKELF